MTTVLSRDPARSRPATDRPLDIVGLELLVCITQALLAGLLLSLANDLGADARAIGLPVPGLLALLGLAVGGAWLWWLVGGSGWPLAAADLAVALLTGALWLLSLQDSTAPHLDPIGGLVAVSCAIYGIVAGVFLPGPRRGHWKGGVSRPRRGLPDTRTSPARFSPQLQKVVDERLTNVTWSKVSLSAVRLPSVRLPSRRSSDVTDDSPGVGPVNGVVPATGSASASEVVAGLDPSGTDAGAAGPSVDVDAVTLIHRILTGEGQSSVSTARLAGTSPTTTALESDDDETLPFPAVDPDAAVDEPESVDPPDHA